MILDVTFKGGIVMFKKISLIFKRYTHIEIFTDELKRCLGFALK